MSAGTALSASAVAELRRNVSSVIEPADDGYDEARKVWNGMIDRRPAAIARCRTSAEVSAAVKFAANAGLPVAIRGGGHSASGAGVCDDGLVIDLSPMRSVVVDSNTRRAFAGGGATWADFDAATTANGLASTGGAISTTGVGGLTLGGGLGYLMRAQGLACDNLVGAELVTADGSVVSVSESANPDLLWGLRGGGGNFGAVTKFEFAVHPIGDVLGGMIVHPIDRAKEVITFYREFMATAPDSVSAFAGLMTSPDGMPMTGLVVAHFGPIAEGERVLEPLRKFGPPIADQVSPMPYTVLQSMLDPGFPSGIPVYWRSHFLAELSDGVIDTLVERFSKVTSPLSVLLLEGLGGAMARVPKEATAFEHRDAPYNLAIIGRYPEPGMASATIDWVKRSSEATAQFARGVYVNYVGVEESRDRVKAAYGPEKYARLLGLKRTYDPENLFRINQNIDPKG